MIYEGTRILSLGPWNFVSKNFWALGDGGLIRIVELMTVVVPWLGVMFELWFGQVSCARTHTYLLTRSRLDLAHSIIATDF